MILTSSSTVARREGAASASNDRTSARRSLATIVDITGNTPHYDAALARALADHPDVVFRTSPCFADRSAFQNSLLRRDFLRTADWLATRWPGLVRHHWLWKTIQLSGYVRGWHSVLKELKRDRTPVLHLQWCKLPFFDVWMMSRAQKLGVRVAYTVHNALPHGDRRDSVRRAYRKLYRQADALIVLSRFVGQQVLDWVDDSVAEKTHVIEHGVLELGCPVPNREEARSALSLECDAEVILFMGQIRADKGITDLIDAFAIASRMRPKLRLIIAGKPEESFDPYQAQIQHLGLKGVVHAYPRYVSEPFKGTLYAAADIAVLPHRDPSQSAMGLEALAVGKPIIVTRAGGLVELVDEEVNGYSVPVRDPESLAHGLDRFFTLPRSRQDAMAAASRALGQDRFGWSQVARKHVDLYRRLAGMDNPAREGARFIQH
jgi:glycosyltransferase involved in cell wall biosynthesis